jgi:hypothetical protein
MALNDIAQKVCGELPEEYEIVIEMERHAGYAHMVLPSGERVDATHTSGMDAQVMELFNIAIESERYKGLVNSGFEEFKGE